MNNLNDYLNRVLDGECFIKKCSPSRSYMNIVNKKNNIGLYLLNYEVDFYDVQKQEHLASFKMTMEELDAFLSNKSLLFALAMQKGRQASKLYKSALSDIKDCLFILENNWSYIGLNKMFIDYVNDKNMKDFTKIDDFKKVLLFHRYGQVKLLFIHNGQLYVSERNGQVHSCLGNVREFMHIDEVKHLYNMLAA